VRVQWEIRTLGLTYGTGCGSPIETVPAVKLLEFPSTVTRLLVTVRGDTQSVLLPEVAHADHVEVTVKPQPLAKSLRPGHPSSYFLRLHRYLDCVRLHDTVLGIVRDLTRHLNFILSRPTEITGPADRGRFFVTFARL
jgi:hypothetical protein